MHLRPYTSADRATCLSLFTSNLPDLFGAGELAIFTAYIDAPTGPYFILEDGRGVAVACGGYTITGPGRAFLNWGVIGRPWHRLGYARLLLYARLSRLSAGHPEVSRVDTHINHYFVTFYESAGFVVDRVIDGGYGLELNRYDIHLDLTPGVRERIARQLAELARQTGYKD
jgi:hypothetical protein